MSVSALKKEGLEELWDVLGEFRHKMEETGHLQHNRQQQRLSWMWSHVEHEVMRRFVWGYHNMCVCVCVCVCVCCVRASLILFPWCE